MTTGEFVAYANLTFLSNIDFGHLLNARGQLVANGNGKLAALQFGIEQFVLLNVVHDELLDKLVSVLVVGPVVALDTVVLQVLQGSCGKLAALCDDFCTCVVFHTHRVLAFGEGEQFVNENVFQVVVLCFVFLINLGKDDFILFLALAGLHCA